MMTLEEFKKLMFQEFPVGELYTGFMHDRHSIYLLVDIEFTGPENGSVYYATFKYVANNCIENCQWYVPVDNMKEIKKHIRKVS